MEYDKIAAGNRAYEARKNKGLKQSDISKILDIGQSTYSHFELGFYDMPISKLLKLCEILDISLYWLIGDNIVSGLEDEERLLVENFIRYIKKVRNKLN